MADMLQQEDFEIIQDAEQIRTLKYLMCGVKNASKMTDV